MQAELTPLSSDATTSVDIDDGGGLSPPLCSSTKWPAVQVLQVFLLLVAVIAALTAAYFGVRYFKRIPLTPSHQFWEQVFTPNRETVIVPADSGLGILQNLTGRPIHLGGLR